MAWREPSGDVSLRLFLHTNANGRPTSEQHRRIQQCPDVSLGTVHIR